MKPILTIILLLTCFVVYPQGCGHCPHEKLDVPYSQRSKPEILKQISQLDSLDKTFPKTEYTIKQAINIQKVVLTGLYSVNGFIDGYDKFVEERAKNAQDWMKGKSINLIKPYQK